jgi:hypothetical protein
MTIFSRNQLEKVSKTGAKFVDNSTLQNYAENQIQYNKITYELRATRDTIHNDFPLYAHDFLSRMHKSVDGLFPKAVVVDV